MRFHTFITDDVPEEQKSDHIKVCKSQDIEVVYHVSPSSDDYHKIYTDHGKMMDSVLEETLFGEIACFLDLDCLPWNKNALQEGYDYALQNRTFVGNAQNISHIHTCNRLYAAASTLFVSREGWEILGKPSLVWEMQGNTQIDTAQSLSYLADEIGYDYRLYYPLGCDVPQWRLGNYGIGGRGTVYPGSYHFGHLRSLPLPELWTQRVESIIAGEELVPLHRATNW